MTKQLSYTRGTLAAPSEDGILTFTASAEGVNRYGFSLTKNRWRTDNFNANPVILWMHMDHMPPIGRGRALVDSKGLRTDVTFDRADPFAMTIENKYRTGFMNAVSVGFDFVDNSGKPISDWPSMSADEIRNEAFYDLAEVSAVPVPADPNALIRQRHALALDFGLYEPDEIGRMTVFDLGAHRFAQGGTIPPGVTIGSGQARTITLDPPVLPGNTDLEQRLSKIEEVLAKLSPPQPPEETKEDPPVDPEDPYDPEITQGFLSAIKL